jgi:hypothetical protein
MIKKSKLFGLAAVITAIVAIAIVGVGVASCSGMEGPEGPEGPQGPKGESGLDGLDGADGSAGADGTPSLVTQYTISYDSNLGSAVKPEKVIKDGKATRPDIPTRAFSAEQIDSIGPGLYLAGDGGWLFGGWYLGDALYDFDTPITETITLTARWTLPSRISDGADGVNAIPSAADYIEKACAYIRSHVGTYILAINQDYTLGTVQSPVAGLHLTIAGIDGERTITSGTDNGRMFNVTVAGATLILGNNITLQGRMPIPSPDYLIYVSNGTFIMEKGSKITGHKSASYAVYATGAASRLIMNGGEISGNESTAVALQGGAEFTMNDGIITGNVSGITNAKSVGGVHLIAIYNTGGMTTNKFIMNGGSVTGNTGTMGDVFLDCWWQIAGSPSIESYQECTLTLSGNPEIETLTMAGNHNGSTGSTNYKAEQCSKIYVAAGWTGSVTNLYLYTNSATPPGAYSTNPGQWFSQGDRGTGKRLIYPITGSSLTTADLAKFNLTNAKFTDDKFPPNLKPLVPTYGISTSGISMGTVVWY